MNPKVYLIDTTIWVHVFSQSRRSRTKKIQQFFQTLPPETKLVTTGIILAEFIRGLGRGKKEKIAREILERYEYLPGRKEIYILAGELARELDRKGLKTPLPDCLIAATTTSYRATLVSDDPHFKRFGRLKLKFID